MYEDLYDLEYNCFFGVYTVTIGGDVILSGTDDYDEAKAFAMQLLEEMGEL
jgi:hypothetical protein